MKNVEEDIIFFELKDNNYNTIVKYGNLNSLPEKFSNFHCENFTDGDLKNIYRKTENGTLHLIVNSKSEFFLGNRSISRTCIIFFSLIPKFKQIELSQKQSFDAIIKRFSHNLINFQKKFKDNFIRLIPDKSVARSYVDFKDEVERRIKENTSAAANDICQMSHRSKDLDAQIETLRIISGFADSNGSFLPIDIKKALYRLTNPFINELKKRNIDISINIDNEYSANHKIRVVHSLFNASIWHIFDNANKYALDNTSIDITIDFESNSKMIFIKMISVSIGDDEKEAIFLENRQGKNIRKNHEKEISDNGNGIGLFVVKKALNLMKATIYVEVGNFIEERDGYPYSENTFVISL